MVAVHAADQRRGLLVGVGVAADGVVDVDLLDRPVRAGAAVAPRLVGTPLLARADVGPRRLRRAGGAAIKTSF